MGLLRRAADGARLPRVMLTGAGQALREHAHVLLRDLDRAREAVRAEAGGPVRGSVTIGLPTTVAMALTLLLLLLAMREGHPEVARLLVESQIGHLLEWLRQGRLTWRCCSTPGRRGRRSARGRNTIADERHIHDPRRLPII